MIDIRRSDDRFHTELTWLDSRHSFSFGPHRDPSNTHHGMLLVSNDDRVAPGAGFSPHPHRDMEIVTWVLDGALEHRDSSGHHGVISPGVAQRMTAGSGIVHSEMNHSSTEPVHFVQMWVPPDTDGLQPSYEQTDIGDRLATGQLIVVASGQDHEGAVRIHQRGATLLAARPEPGAELVLPARPHVHVYVAKGRAHLDGTALGTGDAARLTDHGETVLSTAEPGSEILVWATD